jgi:hypothetical protein
MVTAIGMVCFVLSRTSSLVALDCNVLPGYAMFVEIGVTDTYDLPVPSGSSLPVTYTVDRDNDILVVS